MTDREKLILWLSEAMLIINEKIDEPGFDPFGIFADHLLAKGVRLERKQVTSDENKRWIPVSERFPEPFQLVYVYVPFEQDVTHAYITRHKEWVGVRMNREVTHWMPLPGPPKEE